MTDFTDLISQNDHYSAEDRRYLHNLIADWQIIADLAFADLVLLVPISFEADDDDKDFIIVSQCRPSTVVTRQSDDLVGKKLSPELLPMVINAWKEASVSRFDHYRMVKNVSVCDVCAPVVHDGRVIAVVVRETNMETRSGNGFYETASISVGKRLFDMIASGHFPYKNRSTLARGKYRLHDPRVSDGFIVLSSEGEVQYAAPNAISCFRRIGVRGDMVNHLFSQVITDNIDEPIKLPDSLPMVLTGRGASEVVLETSRAVIVMRSLPLYNDRGESTGSLVLCRDITELRWRERELESKDAIISEVHHRVKNNLQAVSSLLRLQVRRTSSDEVRKELEEAQRRIETIAVVHEGLSQTVDEVVNFDAVISQLLRMCVDLASAKDQRIHISYVGKFGMMPAQDATPLSLVLTELVTNCVEHAFEGRKEGNIRISVGRGGNTLNVVVEDDGIGVGPNEDVDSMSARSKGSGLGTQIVNTFVKNDFGGSIKWQQGRECGTRVEMHMTLRAVE